VFTHVSLSGVPKFYYQAMDSSGATINGSIEAEDSWLARKAVLKQGLKVLELNRFNLKSAADQALKALSSYQGPITLEDLLMFISQLETGLSVGLPLLRLLDMVQEDLKHPVLKAAVRDIAADVSQGALLHKSFAKHPKIFDFTFVGLIKAGELSGRLDQVLGMIFKLTEQRSENRARIKSAVFYPKIVISFMAVVVLVVVYFVIPKVKAFLATFGQDLPPITKFVVGVSDFFMNYWYLVLVAGFAAFFSYSKYSNTTQGRFFIDKYKLKLPLMGDIFSSIELISFCVVLDLLLESGISITESLETLKQSQTNTVFQKELALIETRVTGGESFNKALSESPIFPSNLVGVIAIGEESGRIPEILRRMGKHYQMKVDFNLNKLSKLIEPILLVVIFGFTLVLALAVFLPIWKMSAAVRTGGH
jgi:MSHA biogenesis protein MshG